MTKKSKSFDSFPFLSFLIIWGLSVSGAYGFGAAFERSETINSRYEIFEFLNRVATRELKIEVVSVTKDNSCARGMAVRISYTGSRGGSWNTETICQ